MTLIVPVLRIIEYFKSTRDTHALATDSPVIEPQAMLTKPEWQLYLFCDTEPYDKIKISRKKIGQNTGLS